MNIAEQFLHEHIEHNQLIKNSKHGNKSTTNFILTHIGLFKFIESKLANNCSYCIHLKEMDSACQNYTHDYFL